MKEEQPFVKPWKQGEHPGNFLPQIPPNHIIDHELLRCIAHGSYGEIWLARNALGTYRAIKIVYRKSFNQSRPFEREFEGIRSFEPISRTHEGFVDVLQVGCNEQEGYFYYVMELGDDQNTEQAIVPEKYCPKTLHSEVRKLGRLPVEECLRLGLLLSDALRYLHEKGLSHRDIKPSNIIFVNGAPKLADIGLVTDIGREQSYVGTEGFIPPDGPGTMQADVFALGKVLYEISTGYDRLQFPSLPDNFAQFSDATDFLEFNEVVLQACDNDPRKRYESAKDLHGDLTVLLNGKSVRRLHILERRWGKFKRMSVVTGISLIAVLNIAYPIIKERKLAGETRERQIGSSNSDGIRAMQEGDMVGAFSAFTHTLSLMQDLPASREQIHRLRCSVVMAQCPKLIQMWSGDKQINWVEFSSDGQRVVASTFYGLPEIYSVASGQSESPQFRQIKGLEMASFSPDGKYLAIASHDTTARVWEVSSGKEIYHWEHPARVFYAKYSPDGTRIVTACGDQMARVWDVSTGLLLKEFKQHQDAVLSARFSKDGKLLVTTSRDNTAIVWNVSTGSMQGTPFLHPSWVYNASFSPDGRRIVTACFDRKARVWDVATGQLVSAALVHGDAVVSAEYSPDGLLIATASLDGTVRLWDAYTFFPTVNNSVLKHSGRVMYANFSPEGNRIATACSDGTTRVWDLAANLLRPQPIKDNFSLDGGRFLVLTNQASAPTNSARDKIGSKPVSIPQISHGLKQFTYSSDGSKLLSINTNGTGSSSLTVWDLQTRKALAPSLSFSMELEGAALSRNSQKAITFYDNRFQTWNLITRQPISSLTGCDQKISSAEYNKDESQVIVTSGNLLSVYNASTMRLVFPSLPHPGNVSYAEYSPDGKYLVSCCTDSQLTACFAQLWDAQTGQPMGQPLQHRDGVFCALFSPDGQRVLTASEDFTAAIWDVKNGNILLATLKHDDQVRAASWSADGRFVITASNDKSARVWDATTGEPITPPLVHAWNLTQARFFSDPRRLITSLSRNTAWLWELPMDNRPVQDMVLLSEVLSGARPNQNYPNNSGDGSNWINLTQIYRAIKQKYPDDFRTTTDEILYWHQQQASLAEMNQAWLAAIFHLKCLLAVDSSNPSLIKRLSSAQQKLNKGEPSRF